MLKITKNKQRSVIATGNPDNATKLYMVDNATFADAFNYAVYGGEQLIKPNQLSTKEEASTAKIWNQKVGEKLSQEQYIQRIRDILKECVIKETEELVYVYLGIENQSHIHYAMPLKNALYDVLDYEKQAEAIKEIHRRNKDDTSSDEFLSGFHKEDRLKPVVTLVIYFGTEKWDGPRKLSDMMTIPNNAIKKYILDYEMLLIEPNSIPDEDFKKFSTDLGVVLQILKNASEEKGLENMMRSNEDLTISQKAADVLEACAKIVVPREEGEEKVKVCKAWDDHFKSGKEEGIRETQLEDAKKFARILYEDHKEISYIALKLEQSEDQIKEWLTA